MQINILRKTSRSLGLILLLGTLCYLPFLNKALHIDSDMLVHTAVQMRTDPIDPPLGEYGRHMAVHEQTAMPPYSVYYRNPHPPLLPLLLAPLAGFDTVWQYHLFFLVIYLLNVIGVYMLSGLFVERRIQFWIAAVWAVCPALQINSHNIMWDTAVCGEIIWSLYFFVTGIRSSSPRHIIISGIIAGCGAITKMTVIALYAAVILWCGIQKRQRTGLLWIIPAALIPGLWIVHNIVVFGTIQYMATDCFKFIPGDFRYRFERILSYCGATMIVPLLLYWILWRNRRSMFLYTICLAGTALWSILLSVVLHKPLFVSIAYTLFSSLGLWLIVETITPVTRMKIFDDIKKPERLLLQLFFVLYLLSLLFLPLAAVRFILPLLPFLLMTVGRLTTRLPQREQTWFWRTTIATLIPFTLVLATADYLYADADRRLPHILSTRGYSSAHGWYSGKLSFDYYLYRHGYNHLLLSEKSPGEGDFLIEESIPDHNAVSLIPKRLTPHPVDTLALYYFPFRTIGSYGGFYGNSRIPCSFEPSLPQRRYIIYRLREKYDTF
jgi:hypothetical protein